MNGEFCFVKNDKINTINDFSLFYKYEKPYGIKKTILYFKNLTNHKDFILFLFIFKKVINICMCAQSTEVQVENPNL